MLSARNRLVRSSDFAEVIRRGRRGHGNALTVYATLPPPVLTASASPDLTRPVESRGTGHYTTVGFVVSKAVGNAVVRHRVTRRLRALMRERLSELPPGAKVVVRARPAAAAADSVTLATDLDVALAKIARHRPKDRSAQ